SVLDGMIEGRGQIVTLIAEAGLGKSRLLSEAKDHWRRIRPEGEWRVLPAVPYDSTRPYSIFLHFARSLFGIDDEDPNEAIRTKIDRALRRMGASDDTIQLCTVAFSKVIQASTQSDGPHYEPEIIRQDLFNNMYPA